MSAATLLFFVMGPLGNVPLFLSALRGADPARYRAIILRDMLFALGIMVVFLFVGRILLEILGVSSEALTAAGGVILMIIAIRLIFPTGDNGRPQVFEEPFIVPLAIPYTAGPSVLATILLLMSQEPERWPTWLAAILLAWSAAAVILLASTSLQKLLGERGLTAIERLMGMILIIVAMEMLLNGVRNFFLQ
ncbi:MAG TPA: MarC family protein [Thermomicrobiales bacterium]|jgi:multiple antibiotic resistance protein|nr:MarC family protein [Thermomicrobiales bacterium]